jgi:hypothetical protein
MDAKRARPDLFASFFVWKAVQIVCLWRRLPRTRRPLTHLYVLWIDPGFIWQLCSCPHHWGYDIKLNFLLVVLTHAGGRDLALPLGLFGAHLFLGNWWNVVFFSRHQMWVALSALYIDIARWLQLMCFCVNMCVFVCKYVWVSCVWVCVYQW